MADTAVRLAPTPPLLDGTATLAPGTTLRCLEPRALVRLQVARSAIGRADGIRIGATALPTAAGHCLGDEPAALWLAPDGWLLVAATLDGATLAAQARAACSGFTAAAVDVSDALVTLELTGPRVHDLLARGTGLARDDAGLVPGRCTRTRLAQLPVIVRARGSERVELIVDRAPARWLCDWLIDTGGLL